MEAHDGVIGHKAEDKFKNQRRIVGEVSGKTLLKDALPTSAGVP